MENSYNQSLFSQNTKWTKKITFINTNNRETRIKFNISQTIIDPMRICFDVIKKKTIENYCAVIVKTNMNNKQ